MEQEQDVARSLWMYDHAEPSKIVSHFDLALISAFVCADDRNSLIMARAFPVRWRLFSEWNYDRDEFYFKHGLGVSGEADTEECSSNDEESDED